MDSPPLEPMHDCHLYISGEVVIHPSAAIAPGVLLQADPGSKLLIGARVCIGHGSVLHAHGGTLELQAGAILGTGALIVGQGTIGAEACIGAMTTILNSSVLPKQSIAPRSLIGDFSRPVAAGSSTSSATPVSTPPFPPKQAAPLSQPSSTSTSDTNGRGNPTTPPVALRKTMTQVYGQAYVERIMITMFPHRRALEAAESEPSNAPDPPEPPA